jgi:hypothetical protein
MPESNAPRAARAIEQRGLANAPSPGCQRPRRAVVNVRSWRNARPQPSSYRQHALMPAEPTTPAAHQPGPISAAELFSQLFTEGVQMTGELFADLAQWLQLTSKLAAGGNGTKR